MIAKTPKPPYYAVIFTSLKTDENEGYNETSELMVQLAAKQSGYLGHESARDELLGITVSYWENLEAIKQWKQQTDHAIAQQFGRKQWYKNYKVRICLVERDYEFDKILIPLYPL